MNKDKKYNRTSDKEAKISYKKLGIIALSLVLGGIFVLLAQNTQTGSEISFTTTSLVVFLLGIILSSTSIVLAIVAIFLGKMSEQVMVERSDQSIRLQNDVFTKTTEALRKIESSTGVTEKRIEDIIAGRTGEVASNLSMDLIQSGATSQRNRKELEDEIKNSLSREIFSDDYKNFEERRRNIEEIEKNYDDYIKDVLDEINAIPNVTSHKMGLGEFEGKGHDLFTGVFDMNNKTLGICILSTSPYLGHKNKISSLAFDMVSEISNETINIGIIILDDGNDLYAYLEEFEHFKSVVNTKFSSSIYVLLDPKGNMEEELSQIVDKK